jgi:uncharacterized protein YdbL (DUF1318 family)
MRKSRIALALLSVALSSCITVNIYFPAPEVRQAAEQIVEETWGGKAAAPTPSGSSSLLRVLDALAPARAEAKDVDINVSTAAIRALKESMRQRSVELKPYLAGAKVGIAKDGMLVVRSLEGLPLKDQANVRRLVEAENADRLRLYQEIAKANEFGADRVPEIQRIFGDVWREKAEAGWPIQKDDGTWAKK